MTEYIIGKYKNQTFSIEQGEIYLNFRLRTFRGIIYMSLYDENGDIISGIRCVNNQFLFPRHIENRFGCNVKFVNYNGDYPNSDDFNGATCRFYLYTKDELINME